MDNIVSLITKQNQSSPVNVKVTRSLLIVIIISISLSFFRLGSAKLFDVDEAVFAQASKEMLVNNDWVTPTYNGVNRYDKPILIYWLMAASYKLFRY